MRNTPDFHSIAVTFPDSGFHSWPGQAFWRPPHRQSGFTLLELLVVTLILMVLAGTLALSLGDRGEDARLQATRFQLQQLSEAIEAYVQDNGGAALSVRLSPADFSFLFIQPASATDWSADYRTGWRGPYLRGHKYAYVDVGDDLQLDGSSQISGATVHGEPQTIDNTELSMIGLPDPFDQLPVDEGQSRSWQGCQTTDPTCVLEWRLVSGSDDSLLQRHGRPYLALDLDRLVTPDPVRVARLISLGPNGVYEPPGCDLDVCSRDQLCAGAGDDVVLCLR